MKKGKTIKKSVPKKLMKKKSLAKKVVVPAKVLSTSTPHQSGVKGFVCQMCGYEAFKKAGLFHCPLCLICKGCGKKVRYCYCMEGE